jgi:hypothetical protein
LCGSSVDPLLEVQERHASQPAKCKTEIERTSIGKLVAELRPKDVEGEEARSAEIFVPVDRCHGAIL